MILIMFVIPIYAYKPAPGVGNRHSDHEYRPSGAWEDQFAAVVHARLPRLQRLRDGSCTARTWRTTPCRRLC